MNLANMARPAARAITSTARAVSAVAGLALEGADWALTPSKHSAQASSTAGKLRRSGLSWETYEQIRSLVLPTAAEEAWREIDWQPSLAEAIPRAVAENRPILLWIMNGHPSGCT